MSNTYRWASRRDVKVESSLKSSNITLQENTAGKLLKRNGCERVLFQDELAAWTRSLYKLLGFSLSRVSCCVVSCPVLGWLINSITWADVRQPWSCLSSEPFGGMAAAKHSSFADDSRTIVFQVVVVAEWLRRWTWNPLGFPRVGSNPTDYEHCLVGEHSFYKEIAS